MSALFARGNTAGDSIGKLGSLAARSGRAWKFLEKEQIDALITDSSSIWGSQLGCPLRRCNRCRLYVR